MSTDLRDLLELASDDLAEVDLARSAWDRAHEERRAVRRRVVLGAAAAAAAGAVVTVAVRDGGADGSVPAEPAPTDPATLPTARVGGVTVDLAPDPDAEPLLPRYVDAEALALGRRIGFDDAGPLPKLGPDTGLTSNDASVRAVLLAWSPGAETMVPVLHTPRGGDGREYLVCSGVHLVRADPTQTGQGMVLDSRSIRDDRRAVVFPQPGEVVVLDARTGTAERIPVPDQGLFRAGWAKDGTTVVATGAKGSWLVDTALRTVTRATGPVGPGWVDLVTTDDGVTSLRTFAGSGHLTGSRPLRGPLIDVSDQTVGNTEGWASAHTYLGQTYAGAIARSQGLLAVQGDIRPTPRILAATRTPSVPKGAYRPLVWGPRDVVVLESRSFPGLSQSPSLRLLAWDVIGGGLSLVGEVGPVRPVGYGFTGAYAL
jgi:hypothetical protein